MIPLHKQYEEYPLAARGVVPELDDVLDKVREFHPDAYMEGSAGLARMLIDRETKLFVAYTWGVRRKRGTILKWHYLIFQKGMAY